VPELPTDDQQPEGASDAERASDIFQSSLLTETAASLASSAGSGTGSMLGDAAELPAAADFNVQAASLPGRAGPGSSRTRSTIKRLGWGFWVSVAWCVFVILIAIFANLLPLPNPTQPTASCLGVNPGAGPGAGHILGCDSGSRDILSRVIFGSRISLIVGFASIALGLLFGGTLGLIAGYFRGVFDEIMNVIANVFLSFPALVLGLAIVSFLGNSLFDITLIIAIVAWPLLFRVVRASTIEYAERDYILAVRALGSTRGRILWKQLLPDVIPSAVTYGLVGVGIAIVAEGALSFVGQSVADPAVTWGKMIAQGSNDLQQNVSQLLAPAVAMFLTILAVNFIGDRLRSNLEAREGVL